MNQRGLLVHDTRLLERGEIPAHHQPSIIVVIIIIVIIIPFLIIIIVLVIIICLYRKCVGWKGRF